MNRFKNSQIHSIIDSQRNRFKNSQTHRPKNLQIQIQKNGPFQNLIDSQKERFKDLEFIDSEIHRGTDSRLIDPPIHIFKVVQIHIHGYKESWTQVQK